MRKGAAAWIALALAFADPAFGAPEIKEYPVPNGSHPHDVIVGPNGAPWITDSGQ